MPKQLEERFLKSNGTPNRSEIIREAFRKLGTTAGNDDIKVWAKREMNVKLSRSNLCMANNCRLDVKDEQRLKAVMQVAGNAASDRVPKVFEKVSKMEATRRALKELGNATPTIIQKWIKEKFGMDITTDHVSANKALLKKQEKVDHGNNGSVKAVPVPVPPVVAPAQPVPVQVPVVIEEVQVEIKKPEQDSNGNMILGTITAIQSLIGLLGRDRLKELIDKL